MLAHAADPRLDWLSGDAREVAAPDGARATEACGPGSAAAPTVGPAEPATPRPVPAVGVASAARIRRSTGSQRVPRAPRRDTEEGSGRIDLDEPSPTTFTFGAGTAPLSSARTTDAAGAPFGPGTWTPDRLSRPRGARQAPGRGPRGPPPRNPARPAPAGHATAGPAVALRVAGTG